MDTKNDDNLKSDDLLLYLDKYLTYLLPLKYLNHPYIITNNDGSITKLNCENNSFLEIEDSLVDENENKPNETLKSNCFLTIYTTLSDIKLDGEESSSPASSPSYEKQKSKSNTNYSTFSAEIEKKFNIKDIFADPKKMIKESKSWINEFINYYIFVLNWVKFEKLFKKHPRVNDRILARIMGFAYSILDNIANPDLNPAFQHFYLKEYEQQNINNNDNNSNNNNSNNDKNDDSIHRSDSDMMEISPSTSNNNNSSSSSNNNNSEEYQQQYKRSNSSSSTHSNNYANHIPVLPSNKTSLINFYSSKLKNKILLITKLIRILSRYEISSQLIGKNRGITILLQIMKLFSDSIEIQIECSASMANLASITSNRVKMLEEGCINLILENMNKFISSSDVQAEICATLANLACHDANAKHIVDNDGCDYILRAMITHMDKTDLQIQAFHSLSSLCKYGKEEMEKDRFMQVIKTSILKHQNSVDLMVSACNALGLMALSGMKMTSCKGTILVVILKALKKFQDHQIFQITAFFSLSHLLCIHDNSSNTSNSDIITKYKGVELILTAMKRFPYNISLQTTACFALESIIINHDNHRKEFLELNGIDIILNVMRFDFSLLKKKRLYYKDNRNEIVNTIDENENIDVSITLDIDSSSESLFYSKYKDNSFHSFSKELLLQLFGSVALLNASDNKQCKEMIIKKGSLHYIYLASKKVANCNDLWLVLYYVFTRFSNNNENSDTKSIYMKPSGVPTLVELCSKKIINKYTQLAYKSNLKNNDSQKTLIYNDSCSNINSNNEESGSTCINNTTNNINRNSRRNEREEQNNVNLVLVDNENHNVTIIPPENNNNNNNSSMSSLSSSSSTISSISFNEENINDLEITENDNHNNGNNNENDNNNDEIIETNNINDNNNNVNWYNNPLYNDNTSLNNAYNSSSSENNEEEEDDDEEDEDYVYEEEEDTEEEEEVEEEEEDGDNDMNIENSNNENEDININDDSIIEEDESEESDESSNNEDEEEEEEEEDDDDGNENENEASDIEMVDANNEEDNMNDDNDNNNDNDNDLNDSIKNLIDENPLLSQQKTEEWKQNEIKYINSLPISERIQDYLLSHEYCCICGNACFESCVRLYSINRKKDCSLVYLCSKECAKKDLLFNKRSFYHVYHETAQRWWNEKLIDSLKTSKSN